MDVTALLADFTRLVGGDSSPTIEAVQEAGRIAEDLDRTLMRDRATIPDSLLDVLTQDQRRVMLLAFLQAALGAAYRKTIRARVPGDSTPLVIHIL